MKSFFFFLIILTASFFATGQEYTLDLDSSSLHWTARSTVTGSYSGTLKFKSGSLKAENNEIASTEIVVDMLSLSAENEDLEEHIREEDFFDVEKHQRATFSLMQKTAIANQINAKGKMTIIGNSQEISAPLNLKRIGQQLIVEGRITIDRTKFGIYHNSPSFVSRLKEKAIADEFFFDVWLVFSTN